MIQCDGDEAHFFECPNSPVLVTHPPTANRTRDKANTPGRMYPAGSFIQLKQIARICDGGIE